MPPLYPQDPLAAVQRGLEWRWTDVPVALAQVASEGWALALIALALYAWLEREVKDVLKVFLPLAVALAASGLLALLARGIGAIPRPVSGQGIAPILRQALPTGEAAAAAAFAAYSLLAYGRRARAALLIALLCAVGRVVAGAHWVFDLLGGGLVGAILGALAHAGTIRLFPRGHLARLRARRRAGAEGTLADPPSA